MDSSVGYRRCRQRHCCHRFCCPAGAPPLVGVGREIDLFHLDDLLTSDISNRSIYFANIFRLLVAGCRSSSLSSKLNLPVEMSASSFLRARIGIMCVPKSEIPTNNSPFPTKSSFHTTLDLAVCNLACRSAWHSAAALISSRLGNFRSS